MRSECHLVICHHTVQCLHITESIKKVADKKYKRDSNISLAQLTIVAEIIDENNLFNQMLWTSIQNTADKRTHCMAKATILCRIMAKIACNTYCNY